MKRSQFGFGSSKAHRSIQAAALPFRITNRGEIEVLLVTSKTRSRWILPKGNIPNKMTAEVAAAREALEEGGVEGAVVGPALGAYQQVKKRGCTAEEITVIAFPLLVTCEHTEWREMAARSRRWFTIGEAAQIGGDREIRALIARFAASSEQEPRRVAVGR